MIVIGILLMVLGYILPMHLLWVLGGILVVVGIIFWILGSTGRPVGGRARWF